LKEGNWAKLMEKAGTDELNLVAMLNNMLLKI